MLVILLYWGQACQGQLIYSKELWGWVVSVWGLEANFQTIEI